MIALTKSLILVVGIRLPLSRSIHLFSSYTIVFNISVSQRVFFFLSFYSCCRLMCLFCELYFPDDWFGEFYYG